MQKAQNNQNNLEMGLHWQWLSLHTSSAGSLGLIPGQGPKIPHAMW